MVTPISAISFVAQRPEMGRTQWVDVSFQFNRTIAMSHGRDIFALSTSIYNPPPSPSPSLWKGKEKKICKRFSFGVEEWEESLSTLSWSGGWHHMLLEGPELDLHPLGQLCCLTGFSLPHNAVTEYSTCHSNMVWDHMLLDDGKTGGLLAHMQIQLL